MHPKKSLGQNFLTDPNYKRKIIHAVESIKPQTILEIGPGRGALTSELAKICKKLWLVEKDDDLCDQLKQQFQQNNIDIFHDDFLNVNLNSIFNDPAQLITVVGNLPYNVASQIFIKLLENRKYFDHLFLMFQKEVAKRFVAKPKTKDYGLLSLWAQIYTDCKILFNLPPTVFFPKPKIHSSFVYFKIKEQPLIGDKEAPNFWVLMKKLFQQRRKTIKAVLKDSRIAPRIRAEELSPEELIDINTKHFLCKLNRIN